MPARSALAGLLAGGCAICVGPRLLLGRLLRYEQSPRTSMGHRAIDESEWWLRFRYAPHAAAMVAAAAARTTTNTASEKRTEADLNAGVTQEAHFYWVRETMGVELVALRSSFRLHVRRQETYAHRRTSSPQSPPRQHKRKQQPRSLAVTHRATRPGRTQARCWRR